MPIRDVSGGHGLCCVPSIHPYHPWCGHGTARARPWRWKSPWHDAAVCAEMPGVVFDSIAKRFYFEAQCMLRIACLGMLGWNINTIMLGPKITKKFSTFVFAETSLPLSYYHHASSKLCWAPSTTMTHSFVQTRPKKHSSGPLSCIVWRVGKKENTFRARNETNIFAYLTTS